MVCHGVSLVPLENAVITFVSGIVGVVGMAVVVWLRKKLRLDRRVVARAVVDKAAQNAAGISYSRMVTESVTGNKPLNWQEAILAGVEAVIVVASHQVDYLGEGEESIAARVEGYLGALMARDPSVQVEGVQTPKTVV